EPDYLDPDLFEDIEPDDDNMITEEGLFNDEADLYEKAKQICYERKCASASYLQRRMKIGYNKAARYIEQMEDEGIVGPAQGSKPREILDYTK
ncbi:MAG: DNA translocase FtsK, partial [Spirochaetales bacterium]|nr:DNA translocase FtsK [Spirochaetales bacterium]